METQAYFVGIREVIIGQLTAAKENVWVTVERFTDRTLYNALISCQKRQVRVFLAMPDHQDNRQSALSWEKLIGLGAHIFWIPVNEAPACSWELNYCLIDRQTCIQGSFQWVVESSSAQDTSIVIQTSMAIFQKLKQEFLHLTREEPIRTTVVNHNLATQGNELAVHQDSQVEKWNSKIRAMELNLVALEIERSEMNRQIHMFQIKQEQSIGELLRKYLDVKRQHWNHIYKKNADADTQQEVNHAENEYRNYEDFRRSKKNEPATALLTPLQQVEIKQLYRQLAMRCHPDRVNDQDKAHAKLLFQQLQASYLKSDLVNLKKLQNQIEQGLASSNSDSETILFIKLQKRFTDITTDVQALTVEIKDIKQSTLWRTLSTQHNWGLWFEQQSHRLQSEIDRYLARLETIVRDTAS